MSGQLALVYRPAHAGGEAWQRQLEALRIAVEHLGRKEVAYEIDVNGSTLSDALNERDRKRWAAEWTHVVKAMLASKHDEISAELLRKVCEADMTTTALVVSAELDLSPDDLATIERALAKVRKHKRSR